MRRAAFFAGWLALAAAVPAAPADDWPQWAGPRRDGTSPAAGVFAGPFELREVWRRPAPEGISALTVVSGRVFSVGSGADGMAGGDFAFALDAATGKELWRTPLGGPLAAGLEWGAASTPASDGKLVFVLGGTCVLRALDAATGKEVWKHDLKAEFNPGPMPAGCWTSPLLEGRLLVLQVNGEPDKRVMAFDTATGAVVWTAAGTNRSTRSSPAVADFGGVRQVLVYEGDKEQKGGIYALRLADGAQLWTLRFDQPESYSFDTLLPYGGGRIAAVAWSEMRGVEVRRQGDAFQAGLRWTAREVKAENQPFTSHVVSHAGHLFGFGGELLVCLDGTTGAPVWKEKTYPGSLIVVDGHLVVLSHSAGLVRVVEATPAGYREKARKQVFAPGALTDTPPSFAGGRIYLRNAEEMVALEVARKAGS